MPGDMLKTSTLIIVHEYTASNDYTIGKTKYIKNEQIILFLESLGEEKFIMFYDNKKYVFNQRNQVTRYFPFTIIS